MLDTSHTICDTDMPDELPILQIQPRAPFQDTRRSHTYEYI